MNVINVLCVALGSALGGIGRYAVSLMPVRMAFPVPTLLVNVLGAVLIGFVSGLVSQGAPSGNWVLFLKTGVCGGFTTFSTFSLEAYNMFGDRQYAAGGIYIALSVAGCLLGVFCGEKIAASVFQH